MNPLFSRLLSNVSSAMELRRVAAWSNTLSRSREPAGPPASEAGVDGFSGAAQVASGSKLPPTVSGRPPSLLPYEELSAQPRRFLSQVRTAAEIESIMGRVPPAQEPIRAIAGLASGQTAAGRAGLLMQELQRLGAFDRKYLVISGVTGSGFIDPVTINALEYLTRGNVATAAIQYDDEPSTQSFAEVPFGEDCLRELRKLVGREIERRRENGLPSPTVLLVGESAGAWQAQDSMLGSSPASTGCVARGLFFGTPALARFRHVALQSRRLKAAQFPGHGVLPSAAANPSLRFAFVNHPEDPITRVGDLKSFFIRPKDWPPGQRFIPIVTMLGILRGLPKTTHPQGAEFKAEAHDYRADIPRSVLWLLGLEEQSVPFKALVDRLQAEENARVAALGSP